MGRENDQVAPPYVEVILASRRSWRGRGLSVGAALAADCVHPALFASGGWASRGG